MSKILITGANGFLGQNLIDKLANEHELYGVDRVAINKLDNAHSLVADIGNFKVISSIFDTIKPDVVIHLAAIVHKNNADTSDKNYNFINYECSKNIFDQCKINKVRKVIFTSTIEVYGDVEDNYVDESTLTNPKSFYGISKLKAEQYLTSVFEGTETEVAILRLCPVYGKNFRMNIDKRVFLKPNKIAYYFKDGSYSYQFLSVNNILEFMSFLSSNPFDSGTYLLSDSEMITAKSIIDLHKERGNVAHTIKMPYMLCEGCIGIIDSIHSLVSKSDSFLSKRNFKKLFASKKYSSKKARAISDCMNWDVEKTIYGDN